MIRRAALPGVLALGMLAACATPPRPPADLAGRLAVRIEAFEGAQARSLTMQFELRGDALAGELRLSAPLGTTAARARWQPGGAELITPEATRSFADLDALAQVMLGEPLPLAALIDWLRGRPWPGAPSAATANGFDQLGWRVDLSRHDEGWVLAARERAPAVSVRARLEQPE